LSVAWACLTSRALPSPPCQTYGPSCGCPPQILLLSCLLSVASPALIPPGEPSSASWPGALLYPAYGCQRFPGRRLRVRAAQTAMASLLTLICQPALTAAWHHSVIPGMLWAVGLPVMVVATTTCAALSSALSSSKMYTRHYSHILSGGSMQRVPRVPNGSRWAHVRGE